MDTDEVISEIGDAMENLLEKDVHGFTWDLENKVKLKVNKWFPLIEKSVFLVFHHY